MRHTQSGGLWKHQNNSACTKSVKSLQNVDAGHYTDEEDEAGLVGCLWPSADQARFRLSRTPTANETDKRVRLGN